MYDQHGQPPRRFRATAVGERQIDELIGLCRGVLADGALMQGEAEFLLDWLDRHRDVSDQWPASVLYERVRRVLADGVMDPEEERELLATLIQLTGAPTVDTGAPSASADLPLDDPPPAVIFVGRTFCFTGEFVCGTRREVQGMAEALGGRIGANPTKATDYLVIGALASRDWAHATYGRKIERAIALRESRSPIAIIAEPWWHQALANTF